MALQEPRVFAFAVYGPIARDDLTGLCARIGGLLRASGADVAHCDVSAAQPCGDLDRARVPPRRRSPDEAFRRGGQLDVFVGSGSRTVGPELTDTPPRHVPA